MEENTNININEETTSTEDTQVQETKTFTQADFDSMISKMADKFEKKYEKKYKQQVSLAGLDEKERAIAEKDIALKEMEERLKNYELNQSKMELTKVLGARGLSTELIDIINVTGDVTADQKMIDTIDKIFKAMVAKEVQARIGGSTPKGSVVDTTAMTREKFAQLNDNEKIAFLKSNPDFLK